MTETVMLTIASSLVATLFGLLVLILGWLGSKLYSKLDEMAKALPQLAGDLHTKINAIDMRLVKIETSCNINHHEGDRRHAVHQ